MIYFLIDPDFFFDVFSEAQTSYLNFPPSFRILQALQRMAEDLPLPPNKQSLVIIKGSITMGIIILDNKGKFFKGLTIRGSETNRTGFNSISFERSSFNNVNVTDLSSIYLPKDLLSKASKVLTGKEFRVTSFLFDNSSLFSRRRSPSTNITKTVNSKVLSASVKSVRLKGLNEEEELRSGFTLYQKPGKNQSVNCEFWNNTGQGEFYS